MRHERLHTRTETTIYTSPPPNVTRVITPESFQNFAANNNSDAALACAPLQDPAPPKRQPAATTSLQQVTPTAELDFELIWPDSEDLFQTIMSSDAVNHWQVPLGTLPFPAESYAASNSSFGSPSSFDDRVPSIGTIPSGGNHQAVQNVSKMITSLVSMSITAKLLACLHCQQSSSVTAAAESTSITSVFLDECLHMFFVRFIPTFPVLHRATFVFRDCTHPLLLNAIAIGSLYLGPSDAVTKVSCSCHNLTCCVHHAKLVH
jgi:hypothetical protein